MEAKLSTRSGSASRQGRALTDHRALTRCRLDTMRGQEQQVWQEKDRRMRAAGSQRGGGERRAEGSGNKPMEADSGGLLCPGSCASEALEFPGRGVSSYSASPPEGTQVGLDGGAGHTKDEAGVPTAVPTSGELGWVLGSETPGGGPGSFPAPQGREGPLGTGQKA